MSRWEAEGRWPAIAVRAEERAEHAGRSEGSQACAPMALAVYVQQQRESMLPDHVVQRLADPAVVAVPGRERAARLRRRGRVAAAVSVELGAVQLAGDQVRRRVDEAGRAGCCDP